MVRKLVLIFAFYLFSTTISFAAEEDNFQIPESFFQDLKNNFGAKTPNQAPTPHTTPSVEPTIQRPKNPVIPQQMLLPPQEIQQQPKQTNPCDEIPLYLSQILDEIKNKNSDIISRLPPCFALDRKLILKAVVIDPQQFQYADDILQEDRTFVNRLLKISPEILQFAAPEIRGDESFMENATYISRDALQYAAWKLRDRKLFMKKMIDIDSRNYKFASNRLRELPEFAEIAFKDNGLLLEFAPDKIKEDKKLVKIAILSNKSAIEFSDKKLQQDKELKNLSKQKTSITSEERLEQYLRENYIIETNKKNLGQQLGNRAKFYSQNQLIDRNYITKWHDYINYANYDGYHFARDTKLVAAANRNYHISWREDLAEHKDLIAKINKFFVNHRLPSNVIDNLSTTYFWKIKDKPLTFALNLYLLRESTDEDLGPDFVDVTSMTAILQKRNNKWEMTIVEVILDSEIKVDVSYPNGHKKYILWDLYTVNEKDQNPKIIFKVEDGLEEHFEVFEEQAGGKYRMVFRSKTL